MNEKIERRAADITAADEGNGNIVEGYAAVLEQPTVLYSIDGVEYREVIDKDAFNGADMADVVFKYNHSDNFFTLARTSNSTLTLTLDNYGLKIRADLADIATGRDLYALIQRKDITKMSFAFTVARQEYDTNTRTRRILQFEKIFDVSAVDMPAYDGTSISARDYFAEKIKAEKLEEEKRKLYIMTLL